jgi:hypothetical protein
MQKNNISLIKIRSNPLSMWIKTRPRNVKCNALHALRKILKIRLYLLTLKINKSKH